MNLDRTSQGAAAFVLAQSPRRLYQSEWPGVVVAQGGPDSFDFQPDDPRLPGVSGVPMRLPVPGVTVTVDPSQRPRALLAFAQGDPSKPELHLWERPGLSALVVQATSKISFLAPAVNFGGDPATDALVKGTSFKSAFDTWLLALDAMLTALGAPLGILPPVPPLSTYLLASSALRSSPYLSTITKTS